MKYEELQPKSVFKHFYEISQIPRCSGKEKAVSDFIKNWALSLGCRVKQDEENNLIIKKDGTAGYERSKPVIIQGHLDMVCDKTSDSSHCFEKDPLRLIIEGDRLRADRTTLGGDNGIAVAFAMALLESNDIPHPPLEIVLTTSEEMGMNGTKAIKKEDLESETLINLDAEEEGVFLVSCAGGIRVNLIQELTRVNCSGSCFQVTVGGLKGGHSGSDIHRERGNANKILGNALFELYKTVPFYLVSFSGGSKTNAIPRTAKATITFDEQHFDKLKEQLSVFSNTARREYRASDPDLWMSIEQASGAENAWSKQDTEKFLNTIQLFPSGLLHRSTEIEGLTETSVNLGVMVTEDTRVLFNASIRSSVTSRKLKVVDQLRCLASLTGSTLEAFSDYPPWEYRPESKIREIFVDSYKALLGKEATVTAIHAGLECGLFTETLGNLDMIAVGPNLFDVHTPDETLSISSVAATWELLKEVLKRLK
jgi:dipeptidase D